MSDTYKKGDMVYLTVAAQDFLARNRGDSFNINVVGRLGYISEVYDWDSARGKDILKKRESASKTWSKLKSRDFKYVVVVLYPELKVPDQEHQGMAIPEILCEFHPMAKDKIPLFRKWPKDLIQSGFFMNQEMKLIDKKASKPEVTNVPGPSDKASKQRPRKLPGSTSLPKGARDNRRGIKKV